MSDWPVTLPQDWLLEGAAGAIGDNTLRSQPDVGPAKLRRRSTARPDTWSGDMIMTATQYGILDGFYKTTCAGGSLPFTKTHPVTGSSKNYQFIGPPSYRPSGSYAANGEQYWLVTLNLEILP
jgi:hypothetical protein